MKKRSLHTVEDNQFGRGAPYAFPGDIHEAGKFLTVCTFIESSSDCLERDFYEEEDTEDVTERFKNATKWPLPYLVASAAYHFLAWRSKIDAFNWNKLFYALLTVGEPLFEMIHRNGWAEPNRESIREGFKMELEFVIELDDHKCPYRQIQWFREGGASWFQFGAEKGRASPENLLGCLELAGTNETVARLAVREVFETETLYPFYTALLSATDTNFAPPLPTKDEKRGGENCDPKGKVVKFLRGDALVAKSDLSRMKHTQSFVFKGVLAIVFAIVFCLPRRPLVSQALTFYRNVHSVASVNQHRPPFAMIGFHSILPMKTATGDVQNVKVYSRVEVVRRFTGKVVSPLSLSEPKLKGRAYRPIRLSCFADLRPNEGNQKMSGLPRAHQPIPVCCINRIRPTIPDGETIETHPDEEISYHEYRHEVREKFDYVSLDDDDSNESSFQSDSDSVADSLEDPISLEEIQQLVPVEDSTSPQLGPEYNWASDLTAGIPISEDNQIYSPVDIEPVSEEFANISLNKEAREYLRNQLLQQFPRTKSIIETAGLDLDRLLSSYSSLDSNGNVKVRKGFVAVKHLCLTEDSPELAALKQDFPANTKINVVVAIQRGRGGIGKIVRVGLDGTVCRECDVKEIQTLFNDRFEIDGQKHKIAPFEKNHLTLTPTGLPYDLRNQDTEKYTKEPDRTVVMLLPKGLHKLHTKWWYSVNTQNAVPRYNFTDFYQTVEEFYSATREHDYKLWPKHKDKLAAYGLTPEGIIEATKYGQQLDNAMMNCQIMSEWLQKEETKQVPAFVLNKGIIHAAKQTLASYRRKLLFPKFDEIATREMYESLTPHQQEVVTKNYYRKIREARLVNEDGLPSLTKYYEELCTLARHLEALSRSPQAGREGVTEIQIDEHTNTTNVVIDTFVTLIETILTDVRFIEIKNAAIRRLYRWENPTLTTTLVPKSMSATNELVDTIANQAKLLSMDFTHKTKTKNFTIHKDAKASQALVKECVLEANQMATKEKEKRAYYYGGGRAL